MDEIENLKNGICPNCNSFLYFNKISRIFICSCGWNINKIDYDYILTIKELQNNEYKLPDVEENLKRLNNNDYLNS